MACNLTDQKYKRLANQFFGGLEIDKELPTVTLSRELEKPKCKKEPTDVKPKLESVRLGRCLVCYSFVDRADRVRFMGGSTYQNFQGRLKQGAEYITEFTKILARAKPVLQREHKPGSGGCSGRVIFENALERLARRPWALCSTCQIAATKLIHHHREFKKLQLKCLSAIQLSMGMWKNEMGDEGKNYSMKKPDSGLGRDGNETRTKTSINMKNVHQVRKCLLGGKSSWGKTIEPFLQTSKKTKKPGLNEEPKLDTGSDTVDAEMCGGTEGENSSLGKTMDSIPQPQKTKKATTPRGKGKPKLVLVTNTTEIGDFVKQEIPAETGEELEELDFNDGFDDFFDSPMETTTNEELENSEVAQKRISDDVQRTMEHSVSSNVLSVDKEINETKLNVPVTKPKPESSEQKPAKKRRKVKPKNGQGGSRENDSHGQKKKRRRVKPKKEEGDSGENDNHYKKIDTPGDLKLDLDQPESSSNPTLEGTKGIPKTFVENRFGRIHKERKRKKKWKKSNMTVVTPVVFPDRGSDLKGIISSDYSTNSRGKKGKKCWHTIDGVDYFRGYKIDPTPEGLYKCPCCDKIAPTNKRALSRHINLFHIDTSNGHPCEYCDEKFYFAHKLKQHIREKHSGGYQCDMCGSTLATRASFISHKKTKHLGIKPHACDHCGNRFATKKDLTIHVRRHTGERPFVCHVCADAFIDKQALKKHMRSRHPDAGELEKPDVGVPRILLSSLISETANKEETSQLSKEKTEPIPDHVTDVN